MAVSGMPFSFVTTGNSRRNWLTSVSPAYALSSISKTSTSRQVCGDPREPDLLRTRVEHQDLVFSYPDRPEPVLKGCRVRINQGDRLLLEGPSGGGKSTLASLLVELRGGGDVLAPAPIDKDSPVEAAGDSRRLGRIDPSPRLADAPSVRVRQGAHSGGPLGSDRDRHELVLAAGAMGRDTRFLITRGTCTLLRGDDHARHRHLPVDPSRWHLEV
jgi:hypothetical protein